MTLPRRLPAILLVLTAVGCASKVEVAAPADAWGEVFARVLHLEHEYVEVTESPDPAGVAQQAERATELLTHTKRLGSPGADIHGRVERVAGKVREGRPSHELYEDFQWLKARLMSSGHILTHPQKLPSRVQGERLYQANCAVCHGVDGSADTPIAKTLSPPPVDFQQAESMNPLMPVRVFHSLTYGEAGTAMPSFKALPEDDRWALAFYVFTLRHRCDEGFEGADLKTLATTSDNDLAALWGEAKMWCARKWMGAATPAAGRHPVTGG